MIALGDKPRPCVEVVAQEASGSLLLLHVQTGQYYSLEGVGGRIWRLCDGSLNVDDLVTLISVEYAIPRPTVADDVIDVLSQLVEEGLMARGD